MPVAVVAAIVLTALVLLAAYFVVKRRRYVENIRIIVQPYAGAFPSLL